MRRSRPIAFLAGAALIPLSALALSACGGASATASRPATHPDADGEDLERRVGDSRRLRIAASGRSWSTRKAEHDPGCFAGLATKRCAPVAPITPAGAASMKEIAWKSTDRKATFDAFVQIPLELTRCRKEAMSTTRSLVQRKPCFHGAGRSADGREPLARGRRRVVRLPPLRQRADGRARRW